MLSMEAKTNEGSSTNPDSASTINTETMIYDDMYDYLKQFYEKVSDEQVENIWSFCVNFSKPKTAHWTKAPS